MRFSRVGFIKADDRLKHTAFDFLQINTIIFNYS